MAPHPEKMWGVALPWIESQRGIRAAKSLAWRIGLYTLLLRGPYNHLADIRCKSRIRSGPANVREIPFFVV